MRRAVKKIFAPAFLAILTGCATEPFTRPPLPVLINPDPQLIRDAFARSIPDPCTTDDKVRIAAPFRDDQEVLAALGCNYWSGTFDLAGLSLLGVPLFELSGDRTTTTIQSAIPPLMQHADILRAIGSDIGRMHFDTLPPLDSKIDLEQTKVIYRKKSSLGTMVYEFGGNPTVLLEKRLDGFFGNIWCVRYYDYRPADGKLYPHGMVMNNSHYHYQITVTNLDWSVSP